MSSHLVLPQSARSSCRPSPRMSSAPRVVMERTFSPVIQRRRAAQLPGYPIGVPIQFQRSPYALDGISPFMGFRTTLRPSPRMRSRPGDGIPVGVQSQTPPRCTIDLVATPAQSLRFPRNPASVPSKAGGSSWLPIGVPLSSRATFGSFKAPPMSPSLPQWRGSLGLHPSGQRPVEVATMKAVALDAGSRERMKAEENARLDSLLQYAFSALGLDREGGGRPWDNEEYSPRTQASSPATVGERAGNMATRVRPRASSVNLRHTWPCALPGGVGANDNGHKEQGSRPLRPNEARLWAEAGHSLLAAAL